MNEETSDRKTPLLMVATGYTPDYPWGPAFAESLKQHLPKSPLDHVRYRVIETPERPANKCGTLQAGEFLPFFDHLFDRDVIMFTDADMIMQRPFTEAELSYLMSVGRDEVLAGPNGHRKADGSDDDRLEREAQLLDPNGGLHVLDHLVPGWRDLPVRNCGVLVARVGTWRRVRDMARALLPVVESCFNHYACIQFCLCYCIAKWLRFGNLPRCIHTHGHFGMPEGCTWGENGEVMAPALHPSAACMFMPAVFRHCLNLEPEKGAKPPGP